MSWRIPKRRKTNKHIKNQLEGKEKRTNGTEGEKKRERERGSETGIEREGEREGERERESERERERERERHTHTVTSRAEQVGSPRPTYNTKSKGLTRAPHLLFSIIIEGGAAPESATSMGGFLEFQRVP